MYVYLLYVWVSSTSCKMGSWNLQHHSINACMQYTEEVLEGWPLSKPLIVCRYTDCIFSYGNYYYYGRSNIKSHRRGLRLKFTWISFNWLAGLCCQKAAWSEAWWIAGTHLMHILNYYFLRMKENASDSFSKVMMTFWIPKALIHLNWKIFFKQ